MYLIKIVRKAIKILLAETVAQLCNGCSEWSCSERLPWT